jgi:acrylyl-CoA reductase (NADPH)
MIASFMLNRPIANQYYNQNSQSLISRSNTMSDSTFRALVVDQQESGRKVELRNLTVADLPAGDVLINVAYSTINYKDGLGLTGKGKIYRTNPIVPGIDLAGTVVESTSPQYKPGDQVIATGWNIGERYWGGYSEMARLKAEWLVPLPAGFSLQHAMTVGTAGFTAMLCVLALEKHGMRPGEREVVVTGAAGGVGSVAVALLASAGYRVVASTGRPAEAAYLQELGAQEIIDRSVFTAAGKPLESERWGGAIDTVGGPTLGGLFRTMAYNSAVAACGNAGGFDFTTSVFPFILRGVALLGVESVTTPYAERVTAWERLARDLPLEQLDRMTEIIPLNAVPEQAELITQGRVRGRIVVDVHR